jgi:hypothetical protein
LIFFGWPRPVSSRSAKQPGWRLPPIVTIVTILLQQVNSQLVHDFLSRQNNILFLFLSELMDLFVAGRDQSAANQPNNLAEGYPPL